MTRFARAGKRKFLEASSWSDLSASKATVKPDPKDDTSSPAKDKKLLSKRQNIKTQQKSDVVDLKRQKQIEARRLRRKKRKCCFVCRQYGHQAAECPNKNDMKIGKCFKCGSCSHTTKNCKSADSESTEDFPFAKCFICQEMGHLARSCPANPRGLYPQGGGCKICDSVEHLKRDCPQLLKRKSKQGHVVAAVNLTTTEGTTHTSADAEYITETDVRSKHESRKQKANVVNF